MEDKRKQGAPRRRHAPKLAALRRMALLRLQERLEEDRLSAAELLKVIGGKDAGEEAGLPRGDWVLTLSGAPAKGGDDNQ